jgi:glycine oxidase
LCFLYRPKLLPIQSGVSQNTKEGDENQGDFFSPNFLLAIPPKSGYICPINIERTLNLMQTLRDILIVGGGIIGLSCARELAKAGFHVTLFERGEIGREASWAAAGMLTPLFEAEKIGSLLMLGLESLRIFPDFIAELQEETGERIPYHPHGIICPALDETDLTHLREKFERHRQAGFRLSWLSPEEVVKREPNIVPDLLGAISMPDEHWVDNRKLVEVLRRSSQHLGVTIAGETPVEQFVCERNRVVGVRVSGEMYTADTVINAAGAWASTIPGLPSGVDPLVQPIRGQIVVLQMPIPGFLRHVVFSPKGYMVPRDEGNVLVGSTMERVGFNKDVTAEGIHTLLGTAMRIVPALRSAPILTTWAGLRPGSPDGEPVLGPTPLQGYLLATGHTRKGILLAPITARLITQYVTTQRIPELMKPFLLDRFLK